jgi:hypothetical protein
MTDTITTADAIELAHTYHWFRRDLEAQNDCGILVYGDWLLSMQDRTGVELIDPISLKIIMRDAQERYDADMTADA